MFNLFKRNESTIIAALGDQIIGGQSVLYRLFREGLDCDDQSIRRLELTYFATTVASVAYLRFGKQKKRDEILDNVARNVLIKSIPSSRESLSFSLAAKQYQGRFSEYSALLALLFNPSESSMGCPELTLTMHVFECVTGSSARGHTLDLTKTSIAFRQFVLDHVDFAKNL